MSNHLNNLDDEQRALNAIQDVLRARWPGRTSVAAPLYPDAVPNLSDHLLQLIKIANRTKDCTGQAAQLAGAILCSKCPHHFPARDCPIRKTNQCALLELAEPILHAVRASLTVLNDEPHSSRSR